MCAVANGKAYCWGYNYAGALGDNTTTDRSVPTKVIDTGVLAGRTVTAISQDGYLGSIVDPPVPGGHVCVIASGGLFCWGENSDGQLGNDTFTDSSVPIAVITSGALSGKTIQDVKLGIYHSCVRATNGMYCWGLNNYGQVGDGTNTKRRVPTPVATQPGNLTSSNVVMIGAGANRSCAVISDGRTFCMGLNSSGQIGDGTTINRNVPTESLFLRPVGNQYIF
jgi:alpha-tubulin suppressor-like RCC1 family protein